MNNRIMAMLFALVAAMFISIVPVKAEATCTNHVDTNKNYACDTNGCSEHVHDSVEHAAKNATCKEEGNKRYFTCSDPDCEVVSEWRDLSVPTNLADVTEPKLTTHTPATDAVYTNQGRDSHSYVCSVCKEKIFVAHEYGDNCTCVCGSIKHELSKQGTDKVATCYETGSVSYYWCSRCLNCYTDEMATKILGDSVIPALEHNFTDVEWDGNQQKHWQVCANEGCTEKLYPSEDDHSWKTKDNGDGKHGWVCSECDYVSQDTQDHQYTNDGDNAVRNENSHIYTCTVEGCGNVLSEDHYDTKNGGDCKCDRCGYELPCQYGDWLPQEKTNGGSDYHYKVCSVCENATGTFAHNYEPTKSENGISHVLTCTDCKRSTVQNCTDTTGDPCVCDTCGGNMKHDASMMDTQPERAATCTEKGQDQHYKCRNCGELFDLDCNPTTKADVKRAALGHEGDGYWRCNKDGHYQTCKRYAECETKVTDATGKTVGVAQHTYDKWLFDNDKDSQNHYRLCSICNHADSEVKEPHKYVASESENGTTHKLTCNDCGKITWQNCSDKDGNCFCDVKGCGALRKHVITESTMRTVEAKSAGCETEGWELHYRCEKCDKLFDKDGNLIEKPVIEPTDHDMQAAAVSNSNLYHLYECANEGCSKHEIVPHHDDEGSKDCLCDEPGCGIALHTHTTKHMGAVPATCTAAGTASYFKYLPCGRMFADVEGVMGQEIFAVPTVAALGCDEGGEWEPAEDGKHVKCCTRCGEVVDSEEHDFTSGSVCVCGAHEKLTKKEAKAATCYNEGNIEYWYAVNGDIYADANGIRKLADGAEKIAKLEHTLVWEPMADGQRHQQVCMNDGCTRQPIIQNHSADNSCYCSVCDAVKGGHRLTTHKMETATCAKAGREAYYKCSCGKLYDMGYNPITAPKAIAQLKHDVTNAKVQKDTKEGKHYLACNDCGYRFYENHVMDVEDPMKGNYHQRVCECGELEIEQHYDKNGDKKCDVCNHNLTSTTSADTNVQQHDSVTVYTGDSKTVNSTQSWWQNWLEVLTPSNSGGASSTEQTVVDNANNGSTGNNATTGSTGSNANTGSTGSNATTGNNANTGNTDSSTITGGSSNSGITASETNVIMQFISWFLGLFGF